MLKEIKKADIILVITLVILGLGVSFFLGQNHQASTAVIITVDGEEQGTYDITEDRNIVLPVGNTVTIKDNSVYMSDSTCPGKDCIHQGKINAASSTIVCLPHRVVIEVQGGESEYDSLSK